MRYKVAAFYKFVRLEDFKDIRKPLLETCRNLELSGTILLASEGINGTVAGSDAGIDALVDYLSRDHRLQDLVFKFSHANEEPFRRIKVRLKKEIITLGASGADATLRTGTHVPPAEWNELISDPEVLLLDTRNTYETAIGTFENAVDPKTESFGEMVDFIDSNLANKKKQKIAMYCTGGIRCEKLSAHMLEQGFDQIYQLSGGILKYLEEIPEANSNWKGDCFVFDHRVSVSHGLAEGSHTMCHGCGRALDDKARSNKAYEKGVSCQHCAGSVTDEKRRALRERQKQVDLAKERDTKHIGQKANH